MPTPPTEALAATAGAFLLLAVVFLLLWRRSASRTRALRRRLAEADGAAARLTVSTTDQSGRLRIIRELHDVAVHRVSAMIAHADGARYAGATDPTAAVRAAQTIADTGRATLADLRRVMTLVQDGAAEPRVESFRELFRLLREAGLRVDFEEVGEPYDLDPAAEVAVHRILQEATANSLQHGGEGTTVRVAFTWTPVGLAVRIDDDGFRTAVLARGLSPEAAAAELAYGVDDDLRALTQEVSGPAIQAMRARAELFGGTLTAEHTPGVGFSVAASFPTLRHHNGVHGVDLARR